MNTAQEPVVKPWVSLQNEEQGSTSAGRVYVCVFCLFVFGGCQEEGGVLAGIVKTGPLMEGLGCSLSLQPL